MENIDGQETEINDGITLSEPEVEEQEEIKEDLQEEKPDESAETGEEKKEEPVEEKEDGVQKKINKVIRAKKEAEEREAAERAKREEIEAKLLELQKTEVPEIPPVPDYLDPDYDELMAERDKIIGQHAQEFSRKEALAQIEAEKATENAIRERQKIEEMVKGFDDRTEELKLDKSSLDEGQNVVGKYIVGKQALAQYLLSDENGPLNVLYLSQNLAELEKIGAMNEAQAAVYIATKVTPEAQKLKPKTTQAPEPAFEPQGRGGIKEEDPMLQGATFT